MLIAGAGCGSQQSAQTSAATSPTASSSTAPFPDAQALVAAETDNDNWPLAGKSYSNNRYTALTDISAANVGHLKRAWVTQIADDGQQEAAPVVWNGTMYLSTPHNHVLALDAATGALKWENPYTTPYALLYFVNRGVGLAGGKIFEGTQDCRVIAVDAASGKTAWNVQHCPNTQNSWYSSAAYPYKNTVILGTAGGDNGNRGQVQAFNTADGSLAWQWETIKRDTWPGNTWQHGGGPVWAGLTVDPQTDTVFLPVGNPGPDMVDTKRLGGADLYTDSLVALDISSGKPRVKWYYQLIKNDTHDADPAMPPVLFTGKVAGKDQLMVAVGDKAGDFLIFDRTSGKPLHKIVVSNQTGLFTTVPTLKGTSACPNHGGGIEWNGGSYDPKTNLFLIPSTNECATWKILSADPAYIPGQPYTGGPLPKRRAGTGVLTAIDVGTGKIAWQKQFPYPAQGGVTITGTGVAFTSDLRGMLYAFDTASGKILWQDDVGSSIVAPISVYRANGQTYVALVSGEAGNQQIPTLPSTKGSMVVAYALDAANTVTNTAQAQAKVEATVHVANTGGAAGTGTVPYTPAQVQAGKAVYASQCSACHGAKLQGVSGPALTGASFAHSNLNVSQFRAIVTQQMPLTAPASLKPDQYAAVMAYLLSFDCVKPTMSESGAAPFPVTDQPGFKSVTVGGRSCPVK
ncbi:MAG: Pyrrolo-quinoline quinone [Candidatus Eremiobacteraeota bacterium]|nr:Pyrrolo-quinoline quinone [Candidatus Eremiobacteraeota bacterium]